jgi:hypothetical protein
MIFRFIGSNAKNWVGSAKEGVWEFAKAFLGRFFKRIEVGAGSEPGAVYRIALYTQDSIIPATRSQTLQRLRSKTASLPRFFNSF